VTINVTQTVTSATRRMVVACSVKKDIGERLVIMNVTQIAFIATRQMAVAFCVRTAFGDRLVTSYVMPIVANHWGLKMGILSI